MAEERENTKYRHIWQELRRSIQEDRWQVGERIPSEPELAQTFGVSRGTVRNAIEQLVQEQMLRKEQGRGTFVISTVPRLQKSLDWLASFTDQLQAAGIRATTEVLEARLIAAGEAQGPVLEGFHLGDSDAVVYIRRLRRGDGVPFAIQTVYLRPESVPGILDEGGDLTHLFKLYAERYNVHISFAHEVIRVAVASPEEAAWLEIAAGEPVVIRHRISADQNNYPFEVLHSVDRGDRFEYRYRILADSTRSIR
ncbi:MAG: GntR family transcriptional regulator [Chloroflexota bacterium]